MRKPKNNIFSELYFDQYEVSVNAKNIRYFEVEEHPLIKVNSLLIIIFNIFINSCDIPLEVNPQSNLHVYIFIAGNCE